jgi:amino acid permease
MQKTTGVICLVIGMVLLIWGRKIADSFGSQVQQIFTGAPTDRAVYLYIIGIVLALLGVAQIFWKRKKS